MLVTFLNSTLPFLRQARIFSSMEFTSNVHLNYVCGKRVTAKSSTHILSKVNPCTGRVAFEFPCSGEEDVSEAVAKATEAFRVWSRKSPRERGQVLLKAANGVRAQCDVIAALEVEDTGKPLKEALEDIRACADTLEYFGGIAATLAGTHHSLSGGDFALVRREPLGVVAGIGAWNFPFQGMTWKAAPALACGNAFLFKPSELSPSSAPLLAALLTEAGLPEGGVAVLQGDWRTGELLCRDEGVAKVSFTGSVETGKKIMRACADTMKKVTLELGGKSALLVFEDCDLEAAVKAAVDGNFLTQGEVCSNCTRIYVHESVSKAFVGGLVRAAAAMPVGDPWREGTEVGPLIHEAHGIRVLERVEEARKGPLCRVWGGERVHPPGDLAGGFFVSPCVLWNPPEYCRAAQEEIFGPVACVWSFDTEEEAVHRANDSPYGLAAGVMTRDLIRAHRVSSALEAGTVWVNGYNAFPPELPFGGVKMSGTGRENGTEVLNHYSQLKTVHFTSRP